MTPRLQHTTTTDYTVTNYLPMNIATDYTAYLSLTTHTSSESS